jgi:hypothetical protein
MEKGNLKIRRREEVTYETVQATGFTMGDAGSESFFSFEHSTLGFLQRRVKVI